MSLRVKFNLSLLVVMLLGLGVSGYFLQDLLQKNAREEVLHEAGLMMESALEAARRCRTKAQLCIRLASQVEDRELKAMLSKLALDDPRLGARPKT